MSESKSVCVCVCVCVCVTLVTECVIAADGPCSDWVRCLCGGMDVGASAEAV
jgi:hypothetical protein